jgi:hypothetical protein
MSAMEEDLFLMLAVLTKGMLVIQHIRHYPTTAFQNTKATIEH